MVQAQSRRLEVAADVRFGSKADICAAKSHVRFTPNSDRKSGLPQTVMSALPPKADMCGATRDVRIGPKADSCTATRLVCHFPCSITIGASSTIDLSPALDPIITLTVQLPARGRSMSLTRQTLSDCWTAVRETGSRPATGASRFKLT